MKVIETYTTSLGDTYTLYNTGKGFKSVIEYKEQVSRSGKIFPAYTAEHRHATLSGAMNSRFKPAPAH